MTSELECFDWAMLICSGGDNESSWLQRATVTMVEWETSIARVLHGLGCSLGRPMCHKGHDTRRSLTSSYMVMIGPATVSRATCYMLRATKLCRLS